MKISKVASLSITEMGEKVIKLTSDSEGFEAQINDFVICSLQFDEPLFEKTYNKLREKFELSFVYENVFIPALKRIGALWSSGELFPAQEHFFSELIKQKFCHAIEEVSTSNVVNKKAFLFLPPWEDHDFTLLYANMLLKQAGYQVVNVGSTISIQSIEQCIDKINPDIVFTTFIVGQKVTLLQEFCDALKSFTNAKLLYAGNADLLRLVRTHGKSFYSLKEFDNFFSLNKI